MHNRTTARAVGILFMIATVAGVLSVAFLGFQGDPDSFVEASTNRHQTAFGAFLVLVMVSAIVMIPAALFPVLKRRNEALALGYLVSRTLEAVALLPAAAVPLLLVELNAEASAEIEQSGALQALLLTYDDWGVPISATVFCLGALILYYLLYQSNLVPRPISAWGLLGAGLYLADSTLVMFDLIAPSSALQIALTVPIGVNEMVLATWLITKGFNPQSMIAVRGAETGQPG